jgi:diaminobutyrate-2-oxoglutarate transaminase
MNIFDSTESNVRSYCRSFPKVFESASGAELIDEEGNFYIDFFAGAGSLNYGHNNPIMTEALISYLQSGGVVHGLDMATTAKRDFLETFKSVILDPRGLDYKVQFTGPTGTNAVEAALKLARKIKQRSNVISFTNAFHGLTSGALAVTGSQNYRNEAYVDRRNVTFMPYDGYMGDGVNTLDYVRKLLIDKSSGIDLPAAVIVELIQAEGGVNVATPEWVRELRLLCNEFDMLLIVDDIQVGCGRSGYFFSHEEAGIKPDMIALSKSISGFGLPMSLLLLKPEFDQWESGEHTGTFRGNNLAFVTAKIALDYWRTSQFADEIHEKSLLVQEALQDLQSRFPKTIRAIKGRGMIRGLEFWQPHVAQSLVKTAFLNGLIIELCGAEQNVLKLLPPLIIENQLLIKGIGVIDSALKAINSEV